MIDIKRIRKETDKVKKALENRGVDTSIIDKILQLDKKRKEIVFQIDNLRAERNSISREVAKRKSENQDVEDLLKKGKEVGEKIKKLEEELKEIEGNLNKTLLFVPNIPDDDVPVGPDESFNVEVRKWGEPKTFDFESKAHWDLGPELGYMDFERASKISGSRFVILKGLLAKLERALINFMIDVHVNDHGYIEILPPHLVKRETMVGTGQLPKFEEEAYNTKRDDLFLIPTAEVPLVALHKNEILNYKELPRKYVAYTPCYRREAGSYGKDVRGMIRNHQFDKVELVWVTSAENSNDALEQIVKDAERILQLLKLPYRVALLSTGDMGFTAAKTYDLEVWLPSYNAYKEISSCSNVRDFQARRLNIRYRNKQNKLEFVHTLNGSGLAVGRTLVAIIENYQLPNGKIKVPEVLIPYMNGISVIG